MIPKDPVMLLSFINTRLRDQYKDLETLCEELDITETELVEKLEGIAYHYNAKTNQFS